MARKIKRLKALDVERKEKPGMYPDGGGLYLQIGPSGGKSWVYRYMLGGKARYMGLGPFRAFSLAEARGKAADALRLRVAGIDPIDARDAEIAEARLESAKSITFKDAALQYIEAHKAGWSNAKHADQWPSTLESYVYPVFGSLPVQTIDVTLVMKAIEPIWKEKTETANRVRRRIEAVLDWATARGHRVGDNPARWRGHLENLLPSRARVSKVKHFSAMPYDAISDFMAALSERQGISPLALKFLILTAGRTGEVIGARWSEFDLNKAMWTLPPERIKSRRQHRVPLSRPAIAILDVLKADNDGFVFPGARKGRHLSSTAMLVLRRSMDLGGFTIHGFRSSFRDWAAERTNYSREVAEAALAHVVPDAVERAYRRGDLFDKRRRLMDEWARFCGTKAKAGEVVAIRGGKA